MISYHFKGIIQHMNQKYNGLYLMVGRFNPLTIYHLEAINKMPEGRSVIGMTKTEGNDKNPLPLGMKDLFLGRSLVDRADPVRVHFHCDDVLNAVIRCKEMYRVDEVVLYCGSDRAQDYLRLNTYTEPEGIRVVDVVCVDRLDDQHSATYLRELAKLGKKKEFKALCGYVGRDKDKAYDMIRSHYGCI